MSSRINVDSSALSSSVAVRTTNDSDGYAVVGHVMLTESGGQAQPIGAANPLFVTGPVGTLQDASGSVPLVSTQMLAGVNLRTFLEIQNTGSCYIGINFGSAATLGQGSYMLTPGPNNAGGTLRFAGPGFVPTAAMFAIGSSAGGAVTIKVV